LPSSRPILRKDFIVDPYQLHEARAAGADVVLLIVAALQPFELAESPRAGAGARVGGARPRRAASGLGVGAELIGINNRDLRDFSMDVERTARLMSEIPGG
jgi:indole-3-glycerol phosphate synthase